MITFVQSLVWLSFLFLPLCVACRILVPQAGIEPRQLQWKCWVLTTGLPRAFPWVFFFFKLYNIVLVLPYINMNLPQVYTCSPSWTLFPPPSLYHPSGLSYLLPNLWGLWSHSLFLKFYFSLWRRTICPMMFCWYMPDLCQFSLSFWSSQSLPIPNRKISLLISSLVHTRNNHILPRVCVCVCVCVCGTYISWRQSRLTKDTQSLLYVSLWFYHSSAYP